MTIWILTLVVVGSTVGLGLRQGVIRASFSFLGILFASLLAAPLGSLFQPILKHVGIENDTLAWMIAPIVAFPMVLTVFKAVGGYLHHKQEMHFKHKTSELENSIWKRLNHRLGACVGVLNGTAYVVLINFVIFNFSFWTVQVAASDSETSTTRLINALGKDSQSTGLANTAGAVGTLPDNYYKLADLAGLICQNPGLSVRIARYPMFVSLLERDDLKQLASDNDFTNAWAAHAPMGQILNEPAVQAILKDNDLISTVYEIVETNLDDLETYLKTGKSPKYDSQLILGHWDFNTKVSFAYALLNEPKITKQEMIASRSWMARAYADTFLIVAGDGQAYVKNWPDIKSTPQAGQPQATVDGKGQWTPDDTNYQFTISIGSGNKTLAGTIVSSGQRLLLKEGKTTYVFDHGE